MADERALRTLRGAVSVPSTSNKASTRLAILAATQCITLNDKGTIFYREKTLQFVRMNQDGMDRNVVMVNCCV